MSKTTEQERATNWGIVINKPLDATTNGFNLELIFHKLQSAYTFVAVIMHDSDLKEDGTPNTLHVDGYINTPRIRKGSLLNDLAELLDYPKEVISVEKAINERSRLRYLLHLDDVDKHQYMPFEVLCTDKEYFESCLINRVEKLTEERLIKIVEEEKTTRKIVLRIGAENYKKYALLIRDLRKEMFD